MAKKIKYAPEGDDAVELAKAILSGQVEKTPASMKKWLTEDDRGIEYAEHNDYEKEAGKRNIRVNVIKLQTKIDLWRRHKLDKDGKRVRFGQKFLKKAGFPARPDLLGDIEPEVLNGFVPGRDEFFEQAVEEERKEEEKEKENDNDSLTVVAQNDEEEEDNNSFIAPSVVDAQQHEEEQQGLNDDNNNNNQEEEEEEERHFEKNMSYNPHNIKGQCPIAERMLKPEFTTHSVVDPDYDNPIYRQLLMIRVLIPAGINVDTIEPKVDEKSRKAIHFKMENNRLPFDGKTCCGTGLATIQPKLVADFAANMQSLYNNRPKDKNGVRTGPRGDFESFEIQVPSKIERSFRNPVTAWRKVQSSKTCGIVVNVPGGRVSFFILFAFLEQNIAPETIYDSFGQLFSETVNDKYNPLNSNKKKKKKKKKSKVRISGMSTGMKSMSISKQMTDNSTISSHQSSLSSSSSSSSSSSMETSSASSSSSSSSSVMAFSKSSFSLSSTVFPSQTSSEIEFRRGAISRLKALGIDLQSPADGTLPKIYRGKQTKPKRKVSGSISLNQQEKKKEKAAADDKSPGEYYLKHGVIHKRKHKRTYDPRFDPLPDSDESSYTSAKTSDSSGSKSRSDRKPKAKKKSWFS